MVSDSWKPVNSPCRSDGSETEGEHENKVNATIKEEMHLASSFGIINSFAKETPSEFFYEAEFLSLKISQFFCIQI